MTLLRISTRFKMAQSEDTLRSIDNTFIYNLETLCRAGKSENTLRSIHNIFIYNLEHFAELGAQKQLSDLELWIAFRIVFLLMIPNTSYNRYKSVLVVNCFQNCIFTYDSQPEKYKSAIDTCCELLSELYFYLWFPTIINCFF